MASRKRFYIPKETQVELIAINGEKVFKKIMTYAQALSFRKKKGWIYKIYQLDYSQFNLTQNP